MPGVDNTRDWFAGLAMQGIVSSIDSEDNYQRLRNLAEIGGMTVSQWIARDAYKQADAMLVARAVGQAVIEPTPARVQSEAEIERLKDNLICNIVNGTCTTCDCVAAECHCLPF